MRAIPVFFSSVFLFPKICQLFVSPHDQDEISTLMSGGGLIAFLVYRVGDYVRHPREKSGYHCCHVHKAFIIRNSIPCYSTLASSTRTKPPRHENVKVQLRFVATEYRHGQGNILEVRGGVRSSSRSRGSRSGVKAVMAELSDGMDSMEYSKGQSGDVTRLGFPHWVCFLRKYRWPIS